MEHTRNCEEEIIAILKQAEAGLMTAEYADSTGSRSKLSTAGKLDRGVMYGVTLRVVKLDLQY